MLILISVLTHLILLDVRCTCHFKRKHPYSIKAFRFSRATRGFPTCSLLDTTMLWSEPKMKCGQWLAFLTHVHFVMFVLGIIINLLLNMFAACNQPRQHFSRRSSRGFYERYSFYPVTLPMLLFRLPLGRSGSIFVDHFGFSSHWDHCCQALVRKVEYRLLLLPVSSVVKSWCIQSETGSKEINMSRITAGASTKNRHQHLHNQI